MTPGSRPLTLFTHVPKTSGSSVVERLASGCSAPLLGNELRVMAGSPDGFKIGRALIEGRSFTTDADLLSGHLPPTVADLISVRQVNLAVFLRDPIERTVSALRHSVSKVPPSRYPSLERVMRAGGLIDGSSGTEVDLLDACLESGFNMDVMVRQLSGLTAISHIDLIEDDLAAGLLFKPNFCTRSVPSAADLRSMTDLAIERLERDYCFIGYQGCHEESVQRLGKIMKIRPPAKPLRRKQTDPSALPLDRNDPEVESRLRALNEHDAEMYERITATDRRLTARSAV